MSTRSGRGNGGRWGQAVKSARVGENRRKKIHPCSRSRTLDAPVSAASFPSRRGRGKEKEREGCFLVVRGPGPGQQQAGQIKIWIAPKLQAMRWGSRLAAEGPAWRVASTCVGLAAWAPCSGRGQQQKPGKPLGASQTGNFPQPTPSPQHPGPLLALSRPTRWSGQGLFLGRPTRGDQS